MNTTLQLVIILLPILLISMSVHEMVHAFTSNWLGDDTARLMGRVSLNPAAHIDPFLTLALPLILLLSHSPVLFGAAKPVQVNFSRLKYEEFGGAIVGMSGPLTNLLIAVISATLFNATDPLYGTVTYKIFQIAITLNVGLFVFNSIPWPPLDGSRLLYAFAPRGLQEIMESIEAMGVTSILFLFFIFYAVGGPITDIMTNLIHYLAPGLVISLGV